MLDLKSGKLQGEMREIWGGTGGVWVEGPHMVTRDGRYYLMVSEGGTSYDHRVTIARFAYQVGDGSPVSFCTAATRDLSSEKRGGFTGVYLGMYATGNGKKSTAPADFAWFDYHDDDR